MELIERIQKHICDFPDDVQGYTDLLDMCRNIETWEFDRAHTLSVWLREKIGEWMPRCTHITELFAVYKKALLFDAPFHFDSYLLYIEINRLPKDRFYQPRRRVLKPVVDALQELADNKLDELFLSEPPRVGKTSLLMFFLSWIIGRDGELSNLYSAYSDTITKAFYNGILEIITDPNTYLWKDVFPNAVLVSQNSAEETLNIDRRKRYPSLTCRSLYGTLNGACDCSGFLVSDDLIGGIEEALNKDRMIAAWSKVDNNLIPRAKQSAKLLWCGTRWSMIDPAGIRMELLMNDARFAGRRYKIINLPALNDKGESNFDYDYGVGFSTEYFQQRRASFERNNDMASWMAQYMGEPIERDGSVFSPDDFRYYNGTLPDGVPDRIFLACDTAFGGGDFVSAPICYQYGEVVYVHDVVYDNGDKRVTQPLVANAIVKNGVQASQFEATKATENYKTGVEDLLKNYGYHHNITSKAAPNDKSKQARIFDRAPDIRDVFVFRESGCRSKPYEMFMQNVFSFKMIGKNKNDDAPDSLAMAAEMVLRPKVKAEIFKRLF